MKTTRLSAIPLSATAFTLSAFAVPLSIVSTHLERPGLTGPLLIAVGGLMTTAAMGRIGHFADVGQHSVERVENAWRLIRRVGCRPLPSDQVRSLSGWAITTLSGERHWAWGLKLSAGSLLWLATALGAASLAAAAACLALRVTAMAAPEFITGLPFAPYWSDALLLALPALLWPVARSRLGPLAGAELPGEAEFARAQVELVARLTALRQQAGGAAMTAVDQGLDGMVAAFQRLAPMLAQPAEARPHLLEGLSEMAAELAGEEA